VSRTPAEVSLLRTPTKTFVLYYSHTMQDIFDTICIKIQALVDKQLSAIEQKGLRARVWLAHDYYHQGFI